MTSNLVRPNELNQRLNNNNKSMVLVSSNRQIDWNGILVEQYQGLSTLGEAELPAQSDHWLNLLMGPSTHLAQKRDDHLHESIIQKGECIFVPAG